MSIRLRLKFKFLSIVQQAKSKTITILYYSILFSVIYGMRMMKYTPEVDSKPFKPNRPNKALPTLNNEDPFIKDLRSTITSAYDLYFNNCVGYDEIRPISLTCKNTYGFSSTLIESLETLFLLNLTDQYNRSVFWLQEHFDCSKVQWVNRQQFWSRVIASFIGTYILTGNIYFLQQAEFCASRSLQIGEKLIFPPPFINLATHKYKRKIWRNGTSLAEAGAGLPELISLSYLTNNMSYSRMAFKIIKRFPRSSELLPNLYSIPHGYKLTSLRGLDALTISFYRNMAISYSLHPHRIIGSVLHGSMGSISLWPNVNCSMYAPIFDAQSTLKYRPDSELKLNSRKNFNNYNNMNNNIKNNIKDNIKDNINNEMNDNDKKQVYKKFTFGFNNDEQILDQLKADLSPPYKVFNPGSYYNIGGFRYDGSIIRVLLREALSGQTSSKEQLLKLWNETKKTLKSENNGFSGILHSNHNIFKFDDIMHESFFCQWANALIWLIDDYKKIGLTAKFNERGHLLKCDALIPPLHVMYLI